MATTPDDDSNAAVDQHSGVSESPEFGAGGAQYKPANDPLIGRTLADRYEVISAIASGGMGVVYRGRHILMDKIVAIKMLNAGYVSEPGAVLRFQQEAKIACQLNHPNIVVVHDFGVANENLLYLVMDFVEGQTLAQILDDKTFLPVSRAMNIARQLCAGLEYAHAQGVIHRDLKPGNIMIISANDGSDEIKILDFGLAKFIVEGKQQSLSVTGFALGTGLYMSPEQCRGKKADVRSEIYAVGCVLYEALTGMPPLVGENLLETCQKHIEEIPRPMAEVRPDVEIPELLQAIVGKALEKDPQARYQTAAELKAAIAALNTSADETAPFAAPASRVAAPPAVVARPRALPLMLPVILVIAIAISSIVFFSNNNSHHLAVAPAMDSNAALINPDGIVTSQKAKVLSAVESKAERVAWQKFFRDAGIAFDKEQYDVAEKLLQRAVLEARHSGNMSELLLSLRKLEDVLYVQRKFTDADAMDQEIHRLATAPLRSRAAIVPAGSIGSGGATMQTALAKSAEPQDDRIAHLAISCHKNGQCDTAVSLLEHAVEISKRMYGPHSLRTATRVEELASLYVALDQPKKAEPLMDQVMEIKAANRKSKLPLTKRP